MPVARYCRKSYDSVVADEVIDFAALNIGRAVISSTRTRIKASVSGAWPAIRQPGGNILWISAHVECGHRIGPDFPGGFRFLNNGHPPSTIRYGGKEIANF